MNPPEVDRLAGSRAAVAARRARAEVKRQVSSGERSASEVLSSAARDGVQPEAGLRVSELIGSIPWLGPTRTAKIMQDLRISPSKRLGGLGVHQYQRLHEFLVRRQAPRRSAEPDSPSSRLVVLAGPTAVGKGTVAAYIREHYPDVLLSVSATTRPPRPGERDGSTYFFLTDAQFDAMVGAGQFLEWATVHNAYRYGTPRAPIESALADGRSVLLEIDQQGARQVRAAFPDARHVFLLPHLGGGRSPPGGARHGGRGGAGAPPRDRARRARGAGGVRRRGREHGRRGGGPRGRRPDDRVASRRVRRSLVRGGSGEQPVGVSVLAVAAVSTFGPFATDAYLPALPAVARALDVPASVAQLSVTVFLVGLAVGQLVSGPVSDAAGRRRLLLGGAVVLTIGSALCLAAPNAAVLLAARGLQGLAAGNGVAVGVAVIADRFTGVDAAARFGSLAAVRLIAPVVAPGIGGLILTVTDFRGVFLFLTALGVAVLLVTALGIPETLPPERRQPGGVRHLVGRTVNLLRRPAFRAPVVVQCLGTAGFFVYIGGSSFVLQQQFGIGESLYAVIFATDAAAMVVASVLFRRFVVRVRAERLRSLGLWLCSGGAGALLVVEVLAGGTTPLAVVWVLLAVAVAGNGFCLPATTVLAQDAGRGSAGTAASLSGGLSFLAGALATPLTGLVGAQTVLALAVGMTALPVAALVAARLLPRSARERA